jgi:hypothetical protein
MAGYSPANFHIARFRTDVFQFLIFSPYGTKYMFRCYLSIIIWLNHLHHSTEGTRTAADSTCALYLLAPDAIHGTDCLLHLARKLRVPQKPRV